VNGTQLLIVARTIATFEGCEKLGADGLYHPYLDPIGIPTIGFGEVCGGGQPGMTYAECISSMLHKMQTIYAPPVLKVLPGFLEREHSLRLAACVSWCWNLGEIAWASSGMRRHLVAGNFEAAAANCRLWVNAGGRPLPGLVKRRKIEAQMLLTDFSIDAYNALPLVRLDLNIGE
jgi:lysozyme